MPQEDGTIICRTIAESETHLRLIAAQSCFFKGALGSITVCVLDARLKANARSSITCRVTPPATRAQQRMISVTSYKRGKYNAEIH